VTISLQQPEPAEKAVHCSELQRHFTRAGDTVRAVDGISLGIDVGELFGVIGTSGSGKTTLLNLIGGLDTPTAGYLEVMGQSLVSLNKKELALYRRTEVGTIFQAFHLLPARTALENVELPLLLQNIIPSERKEIALGALEQVGLAARADHRPSELSGGEQQRVAIARALAKDPRLLLADEPTGNLDSRTSRETLELLQFLNRDRALTVILVSHDEQGVGRIADRMVRLEDGRVVEEGGECY
jgi:putative ABC transport system ATP-binding protein